MLTVVFRALLAATLLPAIAAAAQIDSDKEAARQISSYLQKSGQLRNYRIGVTYERGVATLAGTVASAEQRDAAVRLAEQADGVSRVVCQLECPDEDAIASGKNRHNLADVFNDASLASGQNESSGVVRAYDASSYVKPAPAQRAPTLARTSRPMHAAQQPRGNMPLPAPRRGAYPAIRQVSAQGVYPAAGTCPDGNCGPMGPGMCPPDGGMYGSADGMGMQAAPMGFVPHAHGRGPSYENAQMPGYAWPSYASYPNYAALTYPRQYSPTAWPYIGPFYPYPQVPLAWRKVSLEWDDGWWFLDFSAHNSSH